MAPPGWPAPFTVGGPMLNMIFQAASDGDLPLFKRLVTMLDMARGRLKETVEALRVEDAGLLQGLGALHVAANRGRMEVCRYLVEELQVDVNAVDKGGRTPLFFAISCKGVGIAKYLLDHGADPNKSCHNGLSPLHEATTSGDCETVRLLLAKGAYVDPVAFCGTPLHCAATQGHDGILKILLDHNADAGADAKGALTYAVENLHSQKLVSTDFVNCIKKDAAADRVLPDDAMMLDPDDATMYSNRSLCSLRMGDGDKALVDANECRKMRPDWPTACYRQGAALMSLKDYKGACERFLDGLKLDPANTEIEDALRKAYDAMQDVSQHQG
ncbi:protein TANC2-like [Triticum urartu]|uniref:protein TANC2-like n=1 Tax=Triticum urartu TaxID=4572 RepID=UPI0020436021|nr:protein TANC2-like [Triticum urartu]